MLEIIMRILSAAVTIFLVFWFLNILLIYAIINLIVFFAIRV